MKKEDIVIECSVNNGDEIVTYYSNIPISKIFDFLSTKESLEFETRLLNFTTHLSELEEILKIGIAGEITNKLLPNELNNIFSTLDSLERCFYVTDKYWSIFSSRNDEYSLKIKKDIEDKNAKIISQYYHIFDIFSYTVPVTLEEVNFSKTVLNYVHKKIIK